MKVVPLPETEPIKTSDVSWGLLATDLIIDTSWDLIDATMRYYGGHRDESMPATLSRAFKALLDARGERNPAALSQALQSAVDEVSHAATPFEDCPVLAAYSEAVRLLKYSMIEVGR